jgi:hypothetical protein
MFSARDVGGKANSPLRGSKGGNFGCAFHAGFPNVRAASFHLRCATARNYPHTLHQRIEPDTLAADFARYVLPSKSPGNGFARNATVPGI